MNWDKAMANKELDVLSFRCHENVERKNTAGRTGKAGAYRHLPSYVMLDYESY